MTKILIRVPDILHKAIRKRAIDEEISMERAVNIAIVRYMEKTVNKAEEKTDEI